MNQGPQDPTPDGLPDAPTMGDVLELPEPLRALVLWLLRRGEAGLPEVMAMAGLEEAPCRALLETLLGRGFVRGTAADGPPRYRACLATRRPRRVPSDLWELLQHFVHLCLE